MGLFSAVVGDHNQNENRREIINEFKEFQQLFLLADNNYKIIILRHEQVGEKFNFSL